MKKRLLAALAAMFACAPASAAVVETGSYTFYCDLMFGGCAAEVAPSTFDYTVQDNGQTYKWTFVVDIPGATFNLAAPNQVEYYEAIRTATGYDTSGQRPFNYRFDETVAPNLTTIFVWAPKGEPYTCAQPGQVGERCWLYYRVWGNATSVWFTGLPDDTEMFNVNFYAETVPEPATWAMMLLGFGVVGVVARKRVRPAVAA